MKEQANWIRIIYIIGVIALAIGALDPLEGSVVIVAGSALLAFTTFIAKDHHHKIFLVCFILIAVGVISLFYLSSLGGFGGQSDLSWWWGTLILPYPIGWIISIVTLIVRGTRRRKQQAVT